jgi:hypothetical protein
MADILDSSDKSGFIGHVFNFNANSKEEMLNIVQYSLLAVIPIVILNKTIQRFIPDVDEEKGSIEIIIEVILQIIAMFLGIFFIDRIITYIPPYSEKKYEELMITNVILSMLLITLSLQTRLGEKVSILADRVMELWSGEGSNAKKKKKKKVSAGNVGQSAPPPQQYPGSTSIGSLPAVDYDSMYQQQPTPMVGAASPGMVESMEPMAANSGGGGGFGTFF